MNRYKLIAMDLDDTLLDSQLRISPRLKAQIRELRRRGVVITLATGRMYRSARPIALELELDIPLITYQGALIKNCLSGEIIAHRPLPAESAREIIKLAREKELNINFYLNDELYVEQFSPAAEKYARLSDVPLGLVSDLTELLDLPEFQAGPTKIVLIGDPAYLDTVQAEARPLFGSSLHISKSKPFFLEFSDPRGNKGAALEELAGCCGVSREQVMAFGDGFNDLEMVEFAGLGVAMGNAVPELKAVADYVTAGNDDDGVAEALQKFCF